MPAAKGFFPGGFRAGIYLSGENSCFLFTNACFPSLLRRIFSQTEAEMGKKCLKLFLSTLYLSAFTFGGGYVIVSLLKKKFVDNLHWIDDEEMMDLVAIAQSSPGAIAVNGAIVVGYKIAGLLGIAVSVTGAVLPPLIILTVISFFYNAFKESFAVQGLLAGMTAGVSAVILSVVWDMFTGLRKKHDFLLYLILTAAFVLNYFLHINVVYIILGTAVIGAAVTVIRQKKTKQPADSVQAANQKAGNGAPERSPETPDGMRDRAEDSAQCECPETAADDGKNTFHVAEDSTKEMEEKPTGAGQMFRESGKGGNA